MPRGQRREAPPDVIGAAVMVGRIATGEIEEGTEPETKAAAALGKRGGKARAATAADPVSMRRPTEIDIVRKAYELWERSGKPEGRDQEFYLQALQELQAALTDQAPDQPE
jgi:Protein of unknown function (DUF2934)